MLAIKRLEETLVALAKYLSTQPGAIADILPEISRVLGSLLGEKIKEFLQSNAYDQGKLIGAVLGRAIYELVLLLFPVEH